ncbi:MAG: serine O-acetyltransferase [Sphingobacterium sp.]|jgi:serine O-acetyltransferase|uniref:serine O-acetyltransferase n=1 Tax=Sphingobacterium sp. TaxID=341027 RepID=UPI00284F7DD2|nr:serine O-acetyltransferase [Sphingobacterium sp.]MDR3011461.1 serine O-acetyltransferase [Sphingobacterium sp.]
MARYPNYSVAWKYIESDYVRYGKNLSPIKIMLNGLFVINHCFGYSFWFRLSKVRGILYPLAKFMHWRLSRKFGIQIPSATTIGYGFYIGHGIGVVINPSAIIGNNVNISQFTTIGAHGQSAKIGDNVYIGPSVCIVNNVVVGDNSSIGAGAVVIKDVPNNATVAGVPAKVLNFDNPGRFVNNKYKLV